MGTKCPSLLETSITGKQHDANAVEHDSSAFVHGWTNTTGETENSRDADVGEGVSALYSQDHHQRNRMLKSQQCVGSVS